MSAVGRFHEPLSRLNPQSVLPHDPGDPFVIDPMTAAVQFVGDATIAIARQIILNGLYQLDHFRICDPAGLVGAVIECTPWKTDHLASPPDGAMRGPVTIDEFSLTGPGEGRGVFLAMSSSMVSCPTLRSRAAMRPSYSATTLASASS